MNKKLMVATLGLGLVGVTGLANAELKLYGQLDLSLNSKDSDFQNANPATGRPADPILSLGDNVNGVGDDINMKSNQSAVGFKGSEDLGNGLSAFFKVEYQTDLANNDDANKNWVGRDQYIGLASDSYGKLTFGSMSTAYKSPGSKIDAFYRTSIQSRVWGIQSALHRGKGENGQGRTVNTIRYDSPSFYNVKLFGTYNFDKNKYDANDDDTYSLGAQYSGGNLFVAASYIDTQASGPKDTAAAQFIARYDWNALSFHGIYELDKGLVTAARSQGLNTTGYVGGADDDGADLWSVGATYTIGNNLIGFDYGKGSDSKGSDGVGNTNDDLQKYDSWRIGAYHKFSTRTRLYAGYVNQDFDDSGEQDLFSLGMRHNF